MAAKERSMYPLRMPEELRAAVCGYEDVCVLADHPEAEKNES